MDNDRGFLSRASIDDIRLLALDVWVNKESPNPDTRGLISINVSAPPIQRASTEDGARQILQLELLMTATLVDDTPDGIERVRASATVVTAVSCEQGEGDEAEPFLKREALRATYALASNQILFATRMTPMNGLVIPLPDTDVLLSSIEAMERPI